MDTVIYLPKVWGGGQYRLYGEYGEDLRRQEQRPPGWGLMFHVSIIPPQGIIST